MIKFYINRKTQISYDLEKDLGIPLNAREKRHIQIQPKKIQIISVACRVQI